MIQNYSHLLRFRIDPFISGHLKRTIEHTALLLKENHLIGQSQSLKDTDKFTVHFISEHNLRKPRESQEFRIFIQGKNHELFYSIESLDLALVDAILDEDFNLNQIGHLIYPSLIKYLDSKKQSYTSLGLKNLRKLEAKARKIFTGKQESIFTSDFLLSFAQSLVDLEKELIQADDLNKLEKILKHFLKLNIEKTRFHFFSSKNIGDIIDSEDFIILPDFKGEFLGVEMIWNKEDPIHLMKGLFFLNTLVNFFHSQHDLEDPFCDESLWESILDAIPFPVALLTHEAELSQHNSLFAKLGFPPMDCLKLQAREKILVNGIPYNIYRKEVHHLDQPKILIVFFTESFFLKSEGNLTPTGQELGIISSSIAHELNNPIAGIQAAIAVLLLDEHLNPEAQQILNEMKNGAFRCKQLIDTFLGFSRANPLGPEPVELSQSAIEICYQQAQNLLRFRSVESGIRFSFNSIKHASFRSQINPSLLTMTFYLILGELMTLYSHQLLVANKNQIEKVIRGEIVESFQEIQIQLHDLNISNLTISKLIQNLLNIENFVLQLSDYSLRFIYTRHN
jgi:hypothetical protein